jgi:hypothetical protein
MGQPVPRRGRARDWSSVTFKPRAAAPMVDGMRPVLLALALVSTSVGLVGCGRSDIATDPGDGFLVRSYTLEDGDEVWVEVLVDEDMELRRAVLDIEDGLSVDDLVEELAMDRDYELVLDSTLEVLIVEVEGEQLAWIWPDAE